MFIIFLIRTAKPICNGTAGVSGPHQKRIIPVNAVHHQGLTDTANIPVTIHGDQNIASAINTLTNISLLSTLALSQAQVFLILFFIFQFD